MIKVENYSLNRHFEPVLFSEPVELNRAESFATVRVQTAESADHVSDLSNVCFLRTDSKSLTGKFDSLLYESSKPYYTNLVF